MKVISFDDIFSVLVKIMKKAESSVDLSEMNSNWRDKSKISSSVGRRGRLLGALDCWVRCTMFQPTICLSSLNELVGQVQRSQQSEMGLLKQLVRKRRIGFIFSSIIMYKSPATFMKGCIKVKPHKWICDVKLVRHVGRKKEKKQARPFGQWELKKEILVEAKSK